MKLSIACAVAAALLAATAGAGAQNPGTDSPGIKQVPKKGGPVKGGVPNTTGSAPINRSAPGAVRPNPNGAAGGKVPGAPNPDRVPALAPGGQGEPY